MLAGAQILGQGLTVPSGQVGQWLSIQFGQQFGSECLAIDLRLAGPLFIFKPCKTTLGKAPAPFAEPDN